MRDPQTYYSSVRTRHRGALSVESGGMLDYDVMAVTIASGPIMLSLTPEAALELSTAIRDAAMHYIDARLRAAEAEVSAGASS